jgi:hypothetical protein
MYKIILLKNSSLSSSPKEKLVFVILARFMSLAGAKV